MQHNDEDELFGDEVLDYLIYKDVTGAEPEKKSGTGCLAMLAIPALSLPVFYLLTNALSALDLYPVFALLML